ncbi:MAG: LPS sulfotransferase NodH [Myxococcota bacterium]|jgi:LPS sulfotransferase NodH
MWFITGSTVWALNRLGEGAGWLGLRPGLDPAALRVLAVRRAGLADDGAEIEGLTVACESLPEADLSTFGTAAVREILVTMLVQRLRLLELRRSDRSRLRTPVHRPIVIVGLPRSGTTLLHRLLAAVPGHRALRTWELADVLGTGEPSRRRAEAAARLGLLTRLAPELAYKHTFEVDGPEEEVSLFDASLCTPTLWRFARVQRYLEWTLATDPLPAYRVFREILGVLQAQTPDARLVLKLPEHHGTLDALRTVLPDAVFVQPERDPVPVVGSYCSLAASVHGVFSERVDRRALGDASLRLWSWHAAQNAAQQGPDVLQMRYADLRDDPVGAVERVLGHAGSALDADGRGVVQQAADARPHGGRHSYDLADFGLTEAQVRGALAGTG